MASSSSLRLASRHKNIAMGMNRFLTEVCPPVRLGQDMWRIVFSLPLHVPLSPSDQLLTIRVSVGGCRLWLVVSTDVVLTLLESRVDLKEKRGQFALSIPPWVALACLEAVLHETLLQLEQRLGEKVTFALDQMDAPQVPLVLSAQAYREKDNQSISFSLRTDASSFDQLLRYWPAQKRLLNREAINVLANVTVVCHLSLCRIRMKRRRFMRIRAGDAVALMLPVLEDGGIPVSGVVHGAFFLRGRAYPNKLVIDMVERNGGTPKDDDDISFDDDDFESDWDEFDDNDDDLDDYDDDRDYDADDDDDSERAGADDDDDAPLDSDSDEKGTRQPSPPQQRQRPDDETDVAQPPAAVPPATTRPKAQSGGTAQVQDEDDGLDQIPLRIDLHVARLNIPLGNFKSFTPGMTIELEQTLPAMVDFKIDERVVAQGELVDVDGTLGVVVTRVGEK